MTDETTRLEALIKRRDELRSRLASINADYGRGLSADSEERAQELENAETLQEIGRVTAEELDKLERQIAQLQSGR